MHSTEKQNGIDFRDTRVSGSSVEHQAEGYIFARLVELSWRNFLIFRDMGQRCASGIVVPPQRLCFETMAMSQQRQDLKPSFNSLHKLDPQQVTLSVPQHSQR